MSSEAAQHATPAGLCFKAVLTLTEDHCLATAFGDLIDNPREAGARRVRLTAETVPARHGKFLRLSDEGPGLKDFDHLRDAYSFGSSPEKDGRHNYGQGEKVAGLLVGQCVCKLCETSDTSRLIALFSKAMQASDGFPKETMRPIVRYTRDRNGAVWRLDHEKPSAVYNQKLIFQWSPFRALDELMRAFDNFRRSGRTHLVLSGLHERLALTADADAAFSDVREPESKWPWLSSLRHYCAMRYPRLGDDGTPFRIELFGREVVPVDLSRRSPLFARPPVVLEPWGSADIARAAGRQKAVVVKNPTALRLTMGHAFSRDEMRHARRAHFEPGGKVQGILVLHRGTTMQLPQLEIPFNRQGSFLSHGRPQGVGALAIVEAPDECKGNKTKTRMNPDQGGFGDFYHQVPGILRKVCAALASAEEAAEAAVGRPATLTKKNSPAETKTKKKPLKRKSAATAAASSAAAAEGTADDDSDAPDIIERESDAEGGRVTSVLDGSWDWQVGQPPVRVRNGLAEYGKGTDSFQSFAIKETAPGKFQLDLWETITVSDTKVVWQSVESGEWFAATIERANADGSFAVDFGDGDIDPAASRERIRLLPPSTEWCKGAAVECKFAGKLTWTRRGASAHESTAAGVAARTGEDRPPAESLPHHQLLVPPVTRPRDEAEADAAPAHKRARETDVAPGPSENSQLIQDLFAGSTPSANETQVAMLPECRAMWEVLRADGRLAEARDVFRPVVEFMARATASASGAPHRPQRVEL